MVSFPVAQTTFTAGMFLCIDNQTPFPNQFCPGLEYELFQWGIAFPCNNGVKVTIKIA
jgi:hypothetical protein